MTLWLCSCGCVPGEVDMARTERVSQSELVKAVANGGSRGSQEGGVNHATGDGGETERHGSSE